MTRVRQQTVYVTYDLLQGEGNEPLVRAARRIYVPGEIIRQEVGEFKTASGAVTSGVRLTVLRDDAEDVERQLIEVPSHARNVQLHVGQLPDAYQGALDRAA